MPSSLADSVTRLVQEALASAVEDAALNFVETGLGSNYFPENWSRLGVDEKRTKISDWASQTGIHVTVDSVMSAVDSMASNGTEWLTPFSAKF